MLENQIKTCAFTGHRVLEEDFSLKTLKKEVENVVKRGVDYVAVFGGDQIFGQKIQNKISCPTK